jgi:hypothetical protein
MGELLCEFAERAEQMEARLEALEAAYVSYAAQYKEPVMPTPYIRDWGADPPLSGYVNLALPEEAMIELQLQAKLGRLVLAMAQDGKFGVLRHVLLPVSGSKWYYETDPDPFANAAGEGNTPTEALQNGGLKDTR